MVVVLSNFLEQLFLPLSVFVFVFSVVFQITLHRSFSAYLKPMQFSPCKHLQNIFKYEEEIGEHVFVKNDNTGPATCKKFERNNYVRDSAFEFRCQI